MFVWAEGRGEGGRAGGGGIITRFYFVAEGCSCMCASTAAGPTGQADDECYLVRMFLHCGGWGGGEGGRQVDEFYVFSGGRG